MTTLVAAPTRAFFFKTPGTTPTSRPPTPAFHWSFFWRMLAYKITAQTHTHNMVSEQESIAHAIPQLEATMSNVTYRSEFTSGEETTHSREHELHVDIKTRQHTLQQHIRSRLYQNARAYRADTDLSDLSGELWQLVACFAVAFIHIYTSVTCTY